MNNVVAYTSIVFTRKFKRYITPDYYSITGLGSRAIPEPLPRKLMNKGVITLTSIKNINPDVSIQIERI